MQCSQSILIGNIWLFAVTWKAVKSAPILFSLASINWFLQSWKEILKSSSILQPLQSKKDLQVLHGCVCVCVCVGWSYPTAYIQSTGQTGHSPAVAATQGFTRCHHHIRIHAAPPGCSRRPQRCGIHPAGQWSISWHHYQGQSHQQSWMIHETCYLWLDIQWRFGCQLGYL